MLINYRKLNSFLRSRLPVVKRVLAMADEAGFTRKRVSLPWLERRWFYQVLFSKMPVLFAYERAAFLFKPKRRKKEQREVRSV